MKILITGVAGFIGSFTARSLLNLGHDVVGIDNFDPFYDKKVKHFNLDLIYARENKEPKYNDNEEVQRIIEKLDELENNKNENNVGTFEFVELDITNFEGLKKLMFEHRFDAIIHLAAMAGVPHSIQEPRKYTEVNVDGTVNILELCAQTNVKKFVFASTSSVYGDTINIPFNEEISDSNNTISQYGATKRMGEIIAYTYSYLYNIKVTCLRFFTVYGPLQRPYGMAIQKFIKQTYRDEPMTIYGDGSMERDFAYIDDITQGLTASLKLEDRYSIINLGNKSSIPLLKLTEVIKKYMGKGETTFLEAPPTEVQITYADITKAQKVLGYNPSVDIEEGIMRQIEIFNLMPDWYKNLEE